MKSDNIVSEGLNIQQLSNGIRVVTEKMDYLRTISVGVWVKTGSYSEISMNNGISHVIEHMLFKGTKTKSCRAIADIISELGDSINAYTSKEATCIYGTTLCEYQRSIIELFGDMICNPAFDVSELKNEKKVILDEIDMYNDSPDDMVHELLQKNVWKDSSLGFLISGEKKVVRSFTREQIRDYWAAHYTADNIIISVSGSFNKVELLSQLEQAFSSCTAHMAVDTQEHTVRYNRCFYRKPHDSLQLHMNMAFPAITVTSGERFTATVMNSCFGGSNNSRLFSRIRDEKGLAYSVYSYMSAYEYAGLFHIDVALNPAEAVKVIGEIKKIISEFITHGVTNEELTRNKSQIRTEMIMSSESAKSRMSNNGTTLLYNSELLSLDKRLEFIDNVTTDDIRSFAGRYLDIDKSSMCVIGSKKDNDFVMLRRLWQEKHI